MGGSAMRFMPLICLLLSAPLLAAETRTAVPDAPPPTAKIADLAWLAGAWEGEGFGGTVREVYSPPAGGQIVGHFTLLKAGAVAFHEIVSIAESGGSLELRLKHFNADLTGWEEKNDVQRFPLVAVAGDAWYFDGLTMRRDGADGMVAAVLARAKDGTESELVFRYRRAKAGS